MKNYLRNLRSRISNPLRLRIGGNSLDGSMYNSSAEQMITFNLYSAKTDVKNIPVTYGPQILSTLDVRLCPNRDSGFYRDGTAD